MKLRLLEDILKQSEKYLKFENKKKCFLCDEMFSYGTYKLNRYIYISNNNTYDSPHDYVCQEWKKKNIYNNKEE